MFTIKTKKSDHSKLFLDELYPKVEYHLKQNSISMNLQRHIIKFIDKNSEVLYHNAPSKRLYFRDIDKEIVMKLCDFTPKEISNVIKKNEFIGTTWRTLNQPHFWILLLAVKFYMENKKEKEMYQTLVFLTLCFYSSIQYKYFRYEPNENIMAYTINNLSNKYDIKKFGTVFKMLFETCKGNHEFYINELKSGDDLGLRTYISGLRTRINSKIQNIFDEFEKVRKQGLYLNLDEENQDEENFHEMDNASFQIVKISEKVTLKILTGRIEEKLLRIAAQNNGINVNSLRTAVYNIIDKKNHEVKDFIVLILQMYLITGKNEVKSISSKKFILECINTYSKSNTVDKTVLQIKSILDKWLIDCSEKYVKTNRVASKSNFRKAIFFYFIFIIQQYYGS